VVLAHPSDVERACRDLGWRITTDRPTADTQDRVYVAWIRGGRDLKADAVGLGMSPISPKHAIRDAWRSAQETMATGWCTAWVERSTGMASATSSGIAGISSTDDVPLTARTRIARP
jgi:hypothetical protein